MYTASDCPVCRGTGIDPCGDNCPCARPTPDLVEWVKGPADTFTIRVRQGYAVRVLRWRGVAAQALA